jgi:hypothetical protein
MDSAVVREGSYWVVLHCVLELDESVANRTLKVAKELAHLSQTVSKRGLNMTVGTVQGDPGLGRRSGEAEMTSG